jgi:hypothetical protein
MDDESKDEEPRFGLLPASGVPVQVQCDGFKCLAFRDKHGNWKDFFTREPLPVVLGVVMVN